MIHGELMVENNLHRAYSLIFNSIASLRGNQMHWQIKCEDEKICQLDYGSKYLSDCAQTSCPIDQRLKYLGYVFNHCLSLLFAVSFILLKYYGSQLFQARFAQYMPYSGQAAPPMGAFEEQSNERNTTSGHEAAEGNIGPDGDVPATNAAEKPHETVSDEDTKMDDLANGQNGDITSQTRSNGEL